MKSRLFVYIQFVLIIAIALYSDVWGGYFQNSIMIAGAILGLWAIILMKLRVNIFPEVRSSQELYTNGPYRYIRHPMYMAVLMVTISWVFNRFDLITVSMWILLLIDLILKLRYEEELLKKEFDSYESYMKKTKRLLPYLY